jgi:hypothetical protein
MSSLYSDIVENKRCGGGKVVQRQLLYLGEINDASMKVEKEESSGCHAFGAHGLFRTSRRSTAALPIAPFVPDFADAQSGLRLHPDAAARAVMLATSMETS